MRRKIGTSLWIIVAAVLAVSACSPVLPAPAATELPSSTPDLVMTGLIQTLTAVPSFTLTIEKTATVTSTPFPTITPIPSLTPISSFTPAPAGDLSTPESDQSGEYTCELTSKSPTNWTVFTGRHEFDAVWTVKNTGTQMWKAGGAVVMTYIDGTPLQKNKSFKSFTLANDVEPEASLTLTLDMLAPKNEGAYISNWGLVLNKSKSVFCPLSIRIKVEK